MFLTDFMDNKVALADKKEGGYLGRLLWFTITDMKITREDLYNAFVDSGLSTRFLPKPINFRDAFRRASSECEVKGIFLEDGRSLNILVREVLMDRKRIVRQLVREIVDSKNRRLEYRAVAELEVDENGDLHVSHLDNLNKYEVKTINKIERNYKEAKIHYNGRHIREIVVNVLKELNPISVRPSGGVYFVPEKYADTVTALGKFAKYVAKYGTTGNYTRVWNIPVVDTDEQRQMVTESLEDHVRVESEALLRELAEAMKSKSGVTPNVVQTYVEKLNKLKSMIKDYEEMLEEKIETVRVTLQFAEKGVKNLLDKMDVQEMLA